LRLCALPNAEFAAEVLPDPQYRRPDADSPSTTRDWPYALVMHDIYSFVDFTHGGHHHHHTCHRILITCIMVTTTSMTEQNAQPTPTHESASVEPGYLRQPLPLTCNGYHELHAEPLDISVCKHSSADRSTSTRSPQHTEP
jgi:hypothetical protein